MIQRDFEEIKSNMETRINIILNDVNLSLDKYSIPITFSQQTFIYKKIRQYINELFIKKCYNHVSFVILTLEFIKKTYNDEYIKNYIVHKICYPYWDLLKIIFYERRTFLTY